MTSDDETTRRVLWSLPTGLYVLGTVGRAGSGPWNLMTINLVTQASVTPRIVAFSVETSSVTSVLLEEGGVAALSILAREDRSVARRFVKPAADVSIDAERSLGVMSGHEVTLTPSGAPVLAKAAAWLDLAVVTSTRWSSHILFQAEVVSSWADEAFLAGRASERSFEVLRMEDTKMNYGG